MRFKSNTQNGFTVYAVTGVNTVSFAIDFDPAQVHGLLGFGVEREDHSENERYFMRGFKVFESLIPNPTTDIIVSTFEQPIQSFVWDDFTTKEKHEYTYFFYPFKGSPKNLDRTAAPIAIKVKTEDLFDATAHHHIFFNRGVMSSQAYKREFDNLAPDKLPAGKRQKAFDWLSRDLLKGLKTFLEQANAGDKILGCFYEFHYKEAVQLFKDALDRGVDVQLIIDAKVNEYTDKKGKFHESFPREANLRTLLGPGGVNFPAARVKLREASPNYIQHNKFAVFVDSNNVAKAVWTGSTNISEGGIFGHTNVGHWVIDGAIALKYRQYWELLHNDPSGKDFKKAIDALQKDLTADEVATIPNGIIPVFSPRTKQKMLDMYAQLLDDSLDVACITLAFGINTLFKSKLLDHNSSSPIVFMLLEKEDKANPEKPDEFVPLKIDQNVYQAFGSYLKDDLNRWSKETNQGIAGLNGHVIYVHSKFLLSNPLGENPIVITGSANFSENSTTLNDENMIIIKGDKRTADIYFTEFNRLFNHYYFRSIYNKTIAQNALNSAALKESLFLKEDDEWLQKYKVGRLKFKRIQMYRKMAGARIVL
ncbi:phospholipase D-like domain-containing protein [Runella sp.]|uniref:phospholipase D-like domain-containing protein n=1 Tax=Runella sp. TaxID=1960881 RepID=UPI003D098A2E